MVQMPKITVRHYSFQEKDKTPFQADAIFPDGRDYHARGKTPYEALEVLAEFWRRQEERIVREKETPPTGDGGR